MLFILFGLVLYASVLTNLDKSSENCTVTHLDCIHLVRMGEFHLENYLCVILYEVHLESAHLERHCIVNSFRERSFRETLHCIFI